MYASFTEAFHKEYPNFDPTPYSTWREAIDAAEKEKKQSKNSPSRSVLIHNNMTDTEIATEIMIMRGTF